MGVERKIRSQSGQVAVGGDEFGQNRYNGRRWIQCGSVTGPHWWHPGGQEGRGGGLYCCLSTIKPQSAVKCGRGHCGEQFTKGIVGGFAAHTVCSQAANWRRRLTREMGEDDPAQLGKDDARLRSPVGGNFPSPLTCNIGEEDGPFSGVVCAPMWCVQLCTYVILSIFDADAITSEHN